MATNFSSPNKLILWPRSCTSELQLKVNCRLKVNCGKYFGLADQPNFFLQYTFSCNSLVYDPALDLVALLHRYTEVKIEINASPKKNYSNCSKVAKSCISLYVLINSRKETTVALIYWQQ